MKAWHKNDIFSALNGAGWQDSVMFDDDCYFVGESYRFQKQDSSLVVSFVSDIGTGFQGADSIEEVVATNTQGNEKRLWLNRRQDGKWRKAVQEWIKETEKDA